MNDNELSTERRHEIDALRVLALLALITMHSTVGFGPAAKWIGIPQNDVFLTWQKIPVSLFNLLRMPIFYVISGMAIWFSLMHMSTKKVLIHRLRRIAGPLILGWFVMAPLCHYTNSLFYSKPYQYEPTELYFWFLKNILVYMALLTPLAARVASDRGQSVRQSIEAGWSKGYIPLAALVLFSAESLLVDKKDYPAYFYGIHSWLIGFLCFFLGLCCAIGGSSFRNFVLRFRYIFLALAFTFWLGSFIHESLYSERVPSIFMGIQSLLSIGAVLGLATAHLNKTTPFFQYARAAVFPVYILHFPIQCILSYMLFPLVLPATLKLILLNIGILFLSVAIYEFILSRVPVLDSLFGIAKKKSE